MNNLVKLTIKLSIVAALLVVFNYIYKHTLYEKDVQAHSDIINMVRKVVADKNEIIYLGESSNFSYREDDADKRAISDLIGDYFPDKPIGSITKGAFHAGVYYELLRNIPKESAVKTVVVTMNLRSFDASWIYSNLETPLQKSLVLLKNRPPLFNRLMLSFRGYDIKTDAEREKQFLDKWETDVLSFPNQVPYKNVRQWDRAMAEQGITNPDGSRNQPQTELACHYIKTYAFQIDTLKNPRIEDFDKIVKLAKDRNWNLVLNLMAENMEKAEILVGSNLTYLMKQNRDLLVKRYAKNGVVVVDNLEDIPDEQFIDQNWTTEHYAEKGRKLIARNVAEYLKTIYPNDYLPLAEE
jgi:hypothetical protein